MKRPALVALALMAANGAAAQGADWGGSGSGSETWQLYGGVGYAFDAKWSTQIGYRYMDINKTVNGRVVSVSLSGPAISVSYSI